jgi:hypothetical protein
MALQENDLISQKRFLPKAGFRAMIKLNRIAFAKLALERFHHLTDQAPVFITANAVYNFRLSNAHLGNDGDSAVIISEIRKRWPLLVILGNRQHRQRHHQQHLNNQGSH